MPIFAFLKAPLDAIPVNDKDGLDKCYRYQCRCVLIIIWSGYVLLYFTRKNFNVAIPGILASNTLTRSDIGLLAMLLYIIYGLSRFFSDIVSDRSDTRYLMGLRFTAAEVVNILFGFSTSLRAFVLLWVLNALFQDWGSPVYARLLTAWYSWIECGDWWALWNTAHNIDSVLIPMVVGAAALYYGWRAGMAITGYPVILAGPYLCWRPRDCPQAVGLPAAGDWYHDVLKVTQQQEGAGLTHKAILARYMSADPYIWLLSLYYMLVYVVQTAINDWGSLYMSETLSVDLVTASSMVTMFELGDFIDMLVVGWGSDKLFNDGRRSTNLIFAAGTLLSIGGPWLMPFAGYVIQAACLFITESFVFGPRMLIGMATMGCPHKEAAGAATGSASLFTYLGASLSGWPLTQVMDIQYWAGLFVVIAIATGISMLPLLPFLNTQTLRTISGA